MTDEEVEAFIWSEIERKGITHGDMVGSRDNGVDPHPEEGDEEKHGRIRPNLFSVDFGDERMKELLCVGEFNEFDDYPPLKISFHDLFRFWWNHCVEKELVVDEILGDIFEYFKEKMGPPQEERPEMDLTVNFGEVSGYGSSEAPMEEKRMVAEEQGGGYTTFDLVCHRGVNHITHHGHQETLCGKPGPEDCGGVWPYRVSYRGGDNVCRKCLKKKEED